MLDPKLKTEWTVGLRSDKYVQGIGALRSPDGTKYCCLGVYCEVAGLTISENGKTVEGDENGYGSLHKALGPVMCLKLYEMNDSGTPFPQIADFIDANL